MSTGLFTNYGRNTAFKSRKAKTRVAFENLGPSAPRLVWPPARVDLMCDLIADGVSFKQVAERLGVTKFAVIGRFDRIRQSYGWQAK